MTSTSAFRPPQAIIDTWLQTLENSSATSSKDIPNYYLSDPSTLITTSRPLSFNLGTGFQVLSSTFSRCLSETNHELLIVTCFWANSSSMKSVFQLLLDLSRKALSLGRRIRVRICFSSRSIFQKLFQTSSITGKLYPSSSWASLGLPPPGELLGLDMVVKSVFVRPFSVMHPKYILVDRKLAFMPSCNVSWENWFEGCIAMEGGISAKLFDFWEGFWSHGTPPLPGLPSKLTVESTDWANPGSGRPSRPLMDIAMHEKLLITKANFLLSIEPPTTILLPSPHHLNPNFRLFFRTPKPPPTPLNTFLLHIFDCAQRSIFIQTPNLTCSPVITALFTSLQRGIDVHIITSSRLMILEQLVTAGTTTEFEVWKLKRKYRRLIKKYQASLDLERHIKPGVLSMGYFHARTVGGKQDDEPVKTHLKAVIVDEEIAVLGSGNMDRASWYTSQELGIGIFSAEVARCIRCSIGEGLQGRVEYVY